jgi:archaellum component FlaC
LGDNITTIDNSITNIDNSITNIDNSITNLGDEIININNEINNISTVFDEVYNNISNWSITEYGDTYTFSKVSINTVENLNFELTINGDTFIKK